MKNQTSTILRALAEAEEEAAMGRNVEFSTSAYAMIKAAKLREIANRIEDEQQEQGM